MAILYIWLPKDSSEWGHTALQLENFQSGKSYSYFNEGYISLWPAVDKNMSNTIKIQGVRAYYAENYNHDLRLMGREPEVFDLDIYENYAGSKWIELALKNENYHATRNNCCHMVYKTLNYATDEQIPFSLPFFEDDDRSHKSRNLGKLPMKMGLAAAAAATGGASIAAMVATHVGGALVGFVMGTAISTAYLEPYDILRYANFLKNKGY